MYISLVHDWIL